MFDDAPRLIRALGGTRKVCELLGYDKYPGGGAQRVNNWKTRGIPSKVQLQHAALWISAEQAAKKLDRKNNAKRESATELKRPKPKPRARYS